VNSRGRTRGFPIVDRGLAKNTGGDRMTEPPSSKNKMTDRRVLEICLSGAELEVRSHTAPSVSSCKPAPPRRVSPQSPLRSVPVSLAEHGEAVFFVSSGMQALPFLFASRD
jgi:hypothetical protein